MKDIRERAKRIPETYPFPRHNCDSREVRLPEVPKKAGKAKRETDKKTAITPYKADMVSERRIQELVKRTIELEEALSAEKAANGTLKEQLAQV